jgi:hypothetical protein
MVAMTILCRWCGQPIGSNFYEVFDHINCTTLEAEEPAPASAAVVETPIAAGDAEPAAIRAIEKRVTRRQRWLDRRRGKGFLWP